MNGEDGRSNVVQGFEIFGLKKNKIKVSLIMIFKGVSYIFICG
jgi:hypothetical protein